MSKAAQAAGANPRRTPLIGKRAIYGQASTSLHVDVLLPTLTKRGRGQGLNHVQIARGPMILVLICVCIRSNPRTARSALRHDPGNLYSEST